MHRSTGQQSTGQQSTGPHSTGHRSTVRSATVHAFTLNELCLVVAICALLASLLMPMFARVRASADATRCASAIRQLGLGALAYAGDNCGFRVATSITLPTTPTTIKGWALLLTEYFGTRQTLNDGLQTGIYFGCPTWRRDPLYRKLLAQRGVAWMTYWGMGYAINSQPNRPYDPNGNDDWANIYYHSTDKHNYRMVQIRDPSQRLFFAEDLKRNATNDDVLTSSNEFFSNYGPESRQPGAVSGWGIWRRTPESFRHRSGSNYVFFDGHLEYIQYPASLAQGNSRGGPGLGQNDPSDPRWLAR